MTQARIITCIDCGIVLTDANWPRYKTAKHRVHRCRVCRNKHSAAFRRNNPNQRAVNRRSALKSNYGIGQEEYTQLLLKQHGVCAICGQPETELLRGHIKALSVDHDHITGKVRGLLCGKCNHVLGYAGDSCVILTNARTYLERVG